MTPDTLGEDRATCRPNRPWKMRLTTSGEPVPHLTGSHLLHQLRRRVVHQRERAVRRIHGIGRGIMIEISEIRRQQDVSLAGARRGMHVPSTNTPCGPNPSTTRPDKGRLTLSARPQSSSSSRSSRNAWRSRARRAFLSERTSSERKRRCVPTLCEAIRPSRAILISVGRETPSRTAATDEAPEPSRTRRVHQ